VHSEGAPIADDPWLDIPERVEWVTPRTKFNRLTDAVAIACAGNEPAVEWVYGDVCLIVRVGKAGDRLAYPTVEQVERAYRKSEGRDELRRRYDY
jgi:hypothetical protein